VVTREFTPTEPGDFQRKYYAPGIGLFLETDPEGAGRGAQLVACRLVPADARCAALPPP
jgi:hypothetical protein